MAKLSRLMWIFPAFFLFSAVCSDGFFDRILNEDEPCKESCDKTYPLHTYPNPRHSECCKRGCRFFSLVEFVNKSQDQNATRDACMASCMEAYSQTGDRYACNIGCSNQVPFESPSPGSQELLDSSFADAAMLSEDWSSANLLKPFMYMNNVYNNMVDHVSRVISISWSFTMQKGDGQLVIIQSEPEIITEFVDIDEADEKDTALENNDDQSMFRNEMLGANDQENDPSSSLGRSSSDSAASLSDIFFYHKKLQPSGPSSSEDLPVRITVNAYATEEIKSLDWLGCVSKKSGLPRWLLGFVIFLSALVMVWLCFATTATAPEQHVKSQLLSIYGDGDCIRLEKDELKVKQFYDKENDEAQLLPVKVHLPTV